MGKISENKFVIKGKSGKEYCFSMYEMNTEFNSVGAIYIFTRRYYSSTDSKHYHDFIYCGKTGNLSERFDNHHKAACIKKNKANCICIMQINSEDERTKIETDILKGNDFTCNEVLN